MNDDRLAILLIIGLAFVVFGFIGIGICFGSNIIAHIAESISLGGSAIMGLTEFVIGSMSLGALAIIMFLLGLLILGFVINKM